MMEADKVFNLQLTIRKLEEELFLYRNGTTSQELFELLGEKESELKEKEEDIKKATKVCNELNGKVEFLTSANNDLNTSNLELKEQLETAKQEAESLGEVITETEAQLQSQKSTIDKLKEDLDFSDSTIEKLHKRCASLIAKHGEKSRASDQEKQTMIDQIQEYKVINLFISRNHFLLKVHLS